MCIVLIYFTVQLMCLVLVSTRNSTLLAVADFAKVIAACLVLNSV